MHVIIKKNTAIEHHHNVSFFLWNAGESFYLKYLSKITEMELEPLSKDDEMEVMRAQLLQEVTKDYEAIIGNTSQALIEKNKQLQNVIDVCTTHD